MIRADRDRQVAEKIEARRDELADTDEKDLEQRYRRWQKP